MTPKPTVWAFYVEVTSPKLIWNPKQGGAYVDNEPMKKGVIKPRYVCVYIYIYFYTYIYIYIWGSTLVWGRVGLRS